MEQATHVYPAKLDFLYQSIAMYAATIVIYLIARSVIATAAFPTLWQDPLLLLLCGITLLSVIALLYNIFMRRQIVVHPDRIEFQSRARLRTIERADVIAVNFGRGEPTRRRRRVGIRTVKIRLRDRRRPVRISLINFEHPKRLLHELKEWAGPLQSADRSRASRLRKVEGRGSAI